MENNIRSITERQLKYLNILLTKNLGEENRKLYLEIFYNINSSKKLDLLQASEIIEKFHPDNPDREKEVAEVMNKIYEKIGQKKLI
jgi:hypothetical protein